MNYTPEQLVKLLKVAELKECLLHFGLARTGRKAELQQRILDYLRTLKGTAGAQQQREGADTIIRDMYARMRGLPPGHPGSHAHLGHGEFVLSRPAVEQIDHASAAQHSSKAQDLQRQATPASFSGKAGVPNGKHSSSVNGKLAMSPAHRNTQIRCLCDINIDRGNMVQCEGEGCGVWQHCACVGVDATALPKHFWCETCTVQRADPFWRAISHHQLMPPARLLPSLHPGMATPGSTEGGAQTLERIFMLSQATLEPLRRSNDHQLQVACVLLGDEVPFRVHWPKHADLRINNMRMNVARRNITHTLGANARDETVNISSVALSGRNRVTLTAADGHSFCLLMLHVARRTPAEVEGLMAPHETPDDAYARVRRRVAADGDDIEVASTTVSLRCPMTGGRVGRAGRFQGIDALEAFDMDAFLSMAARTRKWQCPHTMRHTCVQQLHNDAFIQGILDRLQAMPDVTEVEVSPEGQWKPASSAHGWQHFRGDPLQPIAKVKPEPDSLGRKGEHPANGQLPDSDSESDESEGAEMRKAAQAVRDAQARKRPKPDVIVISDDSDDEQQSRPSKQAATLQPQHVLPHLHRRPTPAGISHVAQPSMLQNGRVPAHHSARSNSTSTSGHTSGPSQYNPFSGRANGMANRGGPTATGAAAPATSVHQRSVFSRLDPQAQPSSAAAVQSQPQPQVQPYHQAQPQHQQPNPLRVRLPSRTLARPTVPQQGSALQQQQQQQVSLHGRPAQQPSAFTNVPAAGSGPPQHGSGGMHRMASTTSGTHLANSTWHPSQAMPSAFQSPFPSASVPTSLPTSSIHQPPLQQQYQQHRDAETTRPGWMDGASSMLQHSAAARQSSASPSQLWGEAPLPPLPQSEPPSLPADLQPAVSSDSQDWLGMLFEQGARETAANGLDAGLSAFGDTGFAPAPAGPGVARTAAVREVIELSP